MLTSRWNIEQAGRVTLAGTPAGHDARILAELAARTRGTPVLHVALDDLRAATLADTIAFFAPEVEVVAFPAWDCLPYDRVSPQVDIVAQRLATLTWLAQPFKTPAVVLTTVNALTQKILPISALKEASLNAAIGDTLPVEKLRHFLQMNGFTLAGTVREAGEFAVRGGIVDVFPPGYDAPLRLDYFGDEIEAIRSFDPLAQTTTGTLDRFHIGPISEVMLNEPTIAKFRANYRELFGAVNDSDPLYEAVTAGRKFPGVEHWLGLFHPRLDSLFDVLPKSVVTFDHQYTPALSSRLQQIADFYDARHGLYQAAKRNKNSTQPAAVYKPAPVASLYLSDKDIENALSVRAVAELSPFIDDQILDMQARLGRDFADARAQGSEGALYDALRAHIGALQQNGRRVAIACYSKGSAERLASLFNHHAMNAHTSVKNWDELHKCDSRLVGLVVLGLEHGFVSPDLAVITEQDILGDRLVRPARKRKAAKQFQLELGSLNPGDFVVHADHGIGRYEGLITVTVQGVAHDCVKLIYDGNDKLFVPVENLDMLTRYSDAEMGATLDKLGGAGWQSRKARVKKKLKDMADALMRIAALRELQKGEVLAAPEGTAEEFAAHFPYAETEDQLRAIEDIGADLSSGKPMDRLVCGDVGFGKTEVALRAAFIAAQSGMQVAVVVPTTLLARQHFNNFSTRFKGFPFRVGHLSRMVTSAETKLTKEGLKSGEVQIVVGTHALLAKDVEFRNLGLLIIDEEQHFGVKQKERMKELRAEVHVLTLTATPIPRTLQLALAGVRELSLIATPPVDRLAVRTFVAPYDPLVIREALMREHYRGGQSFYVCPRIEDLDAVAKELHELVPEVKTIMAHGRMSPTQLEDIMTAFDARQFDVLLATNIIESGLDLPNANTIIMHRADMFGLAQLYQLRGRVGRGKQRGYAYLTYAPQKALSETAQRRLEVIQTLDQLGAGFQLASHDMDIRGAGNLLGEEQSGHIREVGVELYQQMLDDAVAAARAAGQGAAAQAEDRWTPQINLGMSVLIPELYVTDLNTRMGLYRRLADLTEESEIESMAAEMIDRFGPLPPEVENLLQTVAIKIACRRAGIARVDAGAKGAVIAFYRDSFAKPERLMHWIVKQSGTAKVRPDQKLVLMRAWEDPSLRLGKLRQTLNEMAKLAA